MKLHVVTLFPEMFASFLGAGLLGKAIAQGLVQVGFTSPRDFTTDRHRTVDDAPYGGGSGMVMMPGPVADALDAIDARIATGGLEAVTAPTYGDRAQARRFEIAAALNRLRSLRLL